MGPKKRSQNGINLSGIHIDGAVTAIGQDAEVSAKRIKIESNVPPPKVSTNSKASSIIGAVVPIAGGKIKVKKSIKIKRQVSQEYPEAIFLVKEARIPVNKAKLVEKAPEFAKRYKVDELRADESVRLVDDEDPEVFKGVASHINTGKVDEETKRKYYFMLIKSATKYKIPSLESEMQKYMESFMPPTPNQATF